MLAQFEHRPPLPRDRQRGKSRRRRCNASASREIIGRFDDGIGGQSGKALAQHVQMRSDPFSRRDQVSRAAVQHQWSADSNLRPGDGRLRV